LVVKIHHGHVAYEWACVYPGRLALTYVDLNT
jgi:hypothetical protein